VSPPLSDCENAEEIVLLGNFFDEILKRLIGLEGFTLCDDAVVTVDFLPCNLSTFATL